MRDCSKFQKREWINDTKILFFKQCKTKMWTDGWSIFLKTTLHIWSTIKWNCRLIKITPRMIGKLHRLALFSKANTHVLYCYLAFTPPNILLLGITALYICCFYHFKIRCFHYLRKKFLFVSFESEKILILFI